MPGNTVRRIGQAPVERGTPEVVLRFTGGLNVRPADCPRGISAFPHWHPDPAGGEYAVCGCAAELVGADLI